VSDREVKYVLSGLKKQQAAVKINKQPTRICDLRNWPDVPITDKQVNEFLKEHFKSNPQLYRPTADVWGEITTRFGSRLNQQSGEERASTKERTAKAHIQEPDRANQDSANESPSVGQGGADKKPRKKVQRKKGIPSTLLSKRPPDTEPLGE
jgi:hypothetical protein